MGDYVIETNRLTKYFGRTAAVDHLDLKIPPGSIYGLLGLNGAGKSTTIKMLLGFLKPSYGSSVIFGCDSQKLTPKHRQRIGYVTEGHRLYRYMKIGELEQFQKAFCLGTWDQKLFDEMLDYFELSKRKKIKHLSNGQRAQVSLALTIAPNPELLIMDDPTLGLDVAIRRQFLESMIRLIRREGRTIIFSSHILNDVERVADRIAVIDKGTLRADCTMDEFHDSIQKFRVTYKTKCPDNITLPGLLHVRKDENEMQIVTVKTDQHTIDSFAKESNATYVEPIPMNLEDKFIEYTLPPEKNRLFSWEVS